MVLERVDIELEDEDLPGSVNAFIREAQDRINLFVEETGANPVQDFIPSDSYLVYNALDALMKKRLRAEQKSGKPLFCEWGSGFGIAASMADMLGYNACGIEIEDSLVRQSVQLALDFCLDSRFALGDFDEAKDPRAYRALEHRLKEFKVIFVYPWPKEGDRLFYFFEEQAGAGAYLVTYHGFEDIRIHRKG